jgi:hypothetical protein
VLSLDHFRVPEDDCSNAQSNLENRNSQVVLRSRVGVGVVRPGPFNPLRATFCSQPPRTQKVWEVTRQDFARETIFSDRSLSSHSNILEKRSDESWRLEKYSQVFVP